MPSLWSPDFRRAYALGHLDDNPSEGKSRRRTGELSAIKPGLGAGITYRGAHAATQPGYFASARFWTIRGFAPPADEKQSPAGSRPALAIRSASLLSRTIGFVLPKSQPGPSIRILFLKCLQNEGSGDCAFAQERDRRSAPRSSLIVHQRPLA